MWPGGGGSEGPGGELGPRLTGGDDMCSVHAQPGIRSELNQPVAPEALAAEEGREMRSHGGPDRGCPLLPWER